MYERKINGIKERIFYHLYSKRNLIRDIKDAGFSVLTVKAETILPEKFVVSSQIKQKFDSILRKIFPTSLGYGILIVAGKGEE